MSLIMSSIIGESSGESSSCIDISTRPNRLNYKEGERLDLTGMVVELYEKGKEPVRIEGYDTIPSDGAVLTKNDDVVVIKYKKDGALFKTMLPIDIIYPVGIEVTALDKKIYKPDEGVDLAGLKVVINYNDNTSELINNNEGITTNPSKGIEIRDNKSIEFSYVINGKTYKTLYRIEDYYEKDYDKSISQTWQRYLCTFANGDIDNIKAMLNAARSGYFKMDDYWKVGDIRDGGIAERECLVILGFKLPKTSRIYNKYNQIVIIGIKNYYRTSVYEMKIWPREILGTTALCYSGANYSAKISNQTITSHNAFDYFGSSRNNFNGLIVNSEESSTYAREFYPIAINPQDEINMPTCKIEEINKDENTALRKYKYRLTFTGQIKDYLRYMDCIGMSFLKKENVIGDDAYPYFKTISNRSLYYPPTKKNIPWVFAYDKDFTDRIGQSFEYEVIKDYRDNSKPVYTVNYLNGFNPEFLYGDYIDENNVVKKDTQFFHGFNTTDNPLIDMPLRLYFAI